MMGLPKDFKSSFGTYSTRNQFMQFSRPDDSMLQSERSQMHTTHSFMAKRNSLQI